MAVNTYGLTELGYTILLDRYAQKDKDRGNIHNGDIVVAIIKGDGKDTHQRREIAIVNRVYESNKRKWANITLLFSEQNLDVPLDFLDKPLELTPEQVQHRIAKGVASIEKEEIRDSVQSDFEWALEDFKFVPGGRIMAAAGTDQNLTYMNCFVLPSPHDSRGGIMKTLTHMAEIMSRGGGVGINISSLRPTRAYVKGVNGRSSGSVSWGSLYSFVTGLIEQGGSRRGALMIILNDWHPDIFNFINSKRESGKIVNANISVNLSDAFMDAVKNDGDWELKFPDTSDPEYDTLWDGRLDKWVELGKPVIVYQIVKAREIWDAVIESAWASAEPGIWFGDRANKESNSYFYDDGYLVCTNPCVTGDTLIYTDGGLIRADELYRLHTEIKVVVDGRFGEKETAFRSTPVFKTGVQQTYLLETEDGYEIRATENHQFMTKDGWVALKSLNVGDEVYVLNRKGLFGNSGSLEEGRVLGWVVGDGWFSGDRAHLGFYHSEKEELAEAFAGYVNDMNGKVYSDESKSRRYSAGVIYDEKNSRATVRSTTLKKALSSYGLERGNKLSVPQGVFSGSEDMQRGFLQALFSADGSVQGNLSKGVSVRLTSISEQLLKDTQKILINFGIFSKIYLNRREERETLLPNGAGGKSLYVSKPVHELVISKSSLFVFRDEIGFIIERKNSKLNSLLSLYRRTPNAVSFVSKIKSISPDEIESVYDLTENVTHSFVGNGFVLHNCGEEPLPNFGACNLGAINLSKMYNEETKSIDYDLIYRTARIATRFLDNVLDITPYPLPENGLQQYNERRVGLGVLGLAELLIKAGVRYGGDEGESTVESIYKTIAFAAYETSARLAREKGAFPRYSDEMLLRPFFRKVADQIPLFEDDGRLITLDESVRKYGMRNVTLITQAPVGTGGTMVNTSTGIEPFFSWSFYRKGRLGIFEEKVEVVQKWLQENPGKTIDDLPDYFVTAMDLTPEEHVRILASGQRWNDSSISKTCNVPSDYTVEQVGELYRLMYDLGAKGGTIYRDGSRDEQVLNLTREQAEKGNVKDDTPAKEEKAEEHAEPVLVPTPAGKVSRPKKLNGRTYQQSTDWGTFFVTVNELDNGDPYEVFITIGKSGSDVQAFCEAIGRLVSLSLRYGNGNRRQILEKVVEQLKDIGGGHTSGFGPNKIFSVPDAVAKIIRDNYLDNIAVEPEAEIVVQKQKRAAHRDVCPECGNMTLVREEGCYKCQSCGFSKC